MSGLRQKAKSIMAEKRSDTTTDKPDLPIVKVKDTAVDLLIAERSTLQDRIYKLNQAIEILSA
jgi:hypothetical protein